MTLRYELTDRPGVVAECRNLTRRALHAWFGPAGAPDRQPVADALLLVSELVANARRHGGVPYELRLDRSLRAVWVQVSDTSPRHPRPQSPHRADRPSGHGLYLMERLAGQWGSVPRGRDGKTVWFEMDILPQAARTGRS